MYCDVSTQAGFQASTRDVTMWNIAFVINQVCKAFLPHSHRRLLSVLVNRREKCLKYTKSPLDSMFVSKLFLTQKRSHWYCSYMEKQQKPLLEENVEFHMKKIVFRQWKILLLCVLSLSFYEKIKTCIISHFVGVFVWSIQL